MMAVELLRENPTHSRLLLSFGDMKQLQIRQPSLSLFQMSFINVTCIKDRQWEGINYKVKSDEEEISFFCKTVKASLDISR
jgi:hypothetical protein